MTSFSAQIHSLKRMLFLGLQKARVANTFAVVQFQFKVNTEMENCELWIVQLEIIKLLADYGYTQIPVPIT